MSILKRKKFAIVGDEGIHKKVGQRYWEEIARALEKTSRRRIRREAIANAVLKIGEVLAKLFRSKRALNIATN